MYSFLNYGMNEKEIKYSLLSYGTNKKEQMHSFLNYETKNECICSSTMKRTKQNGRSSTIDVLPLLDPIRPIAPSSSMTAPNNYNQHPTANKGQLLVRM
jgi:hypothetical protein